MKESAYPKVKAWRKENPQKWAAQTKRYNAKHPEKRAAIDSRHYWKDIDLSRERARVSAAKQRRSNPEGQKIRMARYKAKKEAALTEIAGRPRPDVCDLCHELNIRIVFDHCHATGKFRGWLCDRCNRVLGTVKDSRQLLMEMAVYLGRSIESEQTQARDREQIA